jgi:SAM-dependent methyltransferase
MSWQDGIAFEVEFWDRWFRSQGAEWPEDYKKRLDPALPVSPAYVEMLDQIPCNPVRVLDVGAGPLTVFGRTHPRKQVILVPTDALAREYDILLEKYNIVPPVRTIFVEAEKLTSHFSPESFDFVHAQNSIDHCRSPYDAVRQMLTVAKVGGWVRLNHAENEAEKEKYTGFHQWNFTVRDGDFIVWSGTQSVNVSRELRVAADVLSNCANHFTNVTLHKRVPFSA